MKGRYLLSRSVGEAHPAASGFSRWARCTQHGCEGHASPRGKKHWPSKTLALRGWPGTGTAKMATAT